MSIRVILVRPEQPRNVGAVVRAAANFEAEGMWIVAAEKWDAGAEREARVASSGAWEIVRGIHHCATVAEATTGCVELVGTSARRRRGMSAPLTPSDLFAQCPQSGVLTGVLFGPESTGLTTDELRLCHRWIRIPTSPHFPSLNLAQAATLVLYEHWSHYANLPAVDERTSAGADIDAREAFLERLEQAIRARDVFPDALVPVRVSQARRLLHRAKPTAGDLALLDHLVAALRDKGRRRQ